MNKEEYLAKKYRIRKNLLGHTRRAYEMLSPIECPNVLDIGCGTGIPTLEIARLSGGHITGIDIDEQALDTLRLEAEKAGFKIDRRKIILDEPIKQLGVYTVAVRLHPEVTAEIKVWVVKE